MPKIASTHSHLFGGEVSAPDDTTSPSYDRLKFGPYFGIFMNSQKLRVVEHRQNLESRGTLGWSMPNMSFMRFHNF